MMQISPRAFQDIARIRRKFDEAAKDIKMDTQNKVQEVGQLGFNYAYGLAPYLTGALRMAMRLEFPNNNEAIIISSHPAGDIPPIHLLWDTGEYPNVFPTYKIKKPEGMFFMQKTFLLLQSEFAQRLGLVIHRDIEKIGAKASGMGK